MKKSKAASTTTDQPTQMITIPPIKLQTLLIKVVGDSPLIMHRWAEKAKGMMLAKQMGKAKIGREVKDPQVDFEESMYKIGERKGKPVYGFPSVAFKSAAVDACSMVPGITKVLARSVFHIQPEYVEIVCPEGPVMREDMVRVGMGTADIRHRGQFTEWSAVLPITFNPNVITAEQVVNLFNLAGFGIGVGEWRPEKNGQYGRFHVE